LYSPIHINDKDHIEQTECTGDTMKEIPFLEVERKFSIFKESKLGEPLQRNFLFS